VSDPVEWRSGRPAGALVGGSSGGSLGGSSGGSVARLPWRPQLGRVAMLSLHTSPVEQPGVGDAGGMNVYVMELSRRLAAQGVEVDVFTRARSGEIPAIEQIAPGFTVRNVIAGPLEPLPKADLPSQLCAFTAAVLRAEAAREPGWYDLIHSHYWLSGQVGWLAKERWGVPLVHSMHTLARVKNAALAEGDAPEPSARAIGEAQVVEAADRLIANTDSEARDLVELYDADPDAVAVVPPGVDLDLYRPGSRSAARARLGLPAGREVLLFVGRIQPLKAPDLLIRALAAMVGRTPSLRDRLMAVVVGGMSGPGAAEPGHLHRLATHLGVADMVRFEPPATGERLADFYRAASVTVVPSYSESFGLVALESQACGTPVVAARVGGLATTVSDGQSGLLVEGHDPQRYAEVLTRLLVDADLRRSLSTGAVRHAAGFSWDRTVDGVMEVYADALRSAATGNAEGLSIAVSR
jgi:D-inositol-3-phosphate glycosyltransferase